MTVKDPRKGAAIRFEHVSKAYRLGQSHRSLREAIAAAGRALASKRREGADRLFWALRDVSFEVAPGEALGVIGPNGAGKTTTLKLLSGITQPTQGRTTVNGRISALIELGAGFHPDLTGRENVYLNATILGLTQREIDRRFDAIVGFAELERFIDTPVKRYSSGMYVRLGFAVAAHVDPEILLVDEVLAVGDARFRERCTEHMQNLRRKGTTVLLVSHNIHQIRSMCNRALLLVGGRLCAEGPPEIVIEEYEREMLAAAHEQKTESGLPQAGEIAGEGLAITRLEMSRASGATEGAMALYSDEPASLLIGYRAAPTRRIGRVHIEIIRTDGTVCSAIDSQMAQASHLGLDQLDGEGMLEVVYHPLQLATGQYIAVVGVTDPSDSQVIASKWSSSFQVVKPGGESRGVYVPDVTWALRRATIGKSTGR